MGGTPPWVPHQNWLGGTPMEGDTPPWVPPSDLARGYPTLGTPFPHQTWLGGTPMGGTPPRVPPSDLAWGGTPTGGVGDYPTEWYLIRRGQYASCVHAGGLSCLVILLTEDFFKISKIKMAKVAFLRIFRHNDLLYTCLVANPEFITWRCPPTIGGAKAILRQLFRKPYDIK